MMEEMLDWVAEYSTLGRKSEPEVVAVNKARRLMRSVDLKKRRLKNGVKSVTI